jgi:hypothetical protein
MATLDAKMADFDDFKPRRKLVTYGKPVKRVQKNIPGFESMKASSTLLPSIGLPLTQQSPARKQSHIDPSSDDSRSDIISVPSDKSLIGKKQASSRSKSEGNGGHPYRLQKPPKKDSQQRRIEIGVFDIPSSDEELRISGSGTPRKRRRLSPAAKNSSNTLHENESPQRLVGVEIPAGHSEPPLTSNLIKPPKLSANLLKGLTRPSKLQTASTDTRMTVTRERSLGARSVESSSSTESKRQGARKIPAQLPHSTLLQTDISRGRSETPRRTPSPTSVLLNELLASASSENSPSRLGMKRLNILGSTDVSPGSESADDRHSSTLQRINNSLQRLPRPRHRLIDALGNTSAGKNEQSSDEESSDGESDRSGIGIHQPVLISHQDNRSDIEINVNSRSNHANDPQPQTSSQPGPIRTYARQRSYLSEIVLEDANALEDIPPSHSRFQVPEFGGDSQASLGSIIEDTDLTADAASGGLRSIHELRQAGGNARVLGDIESILDDLEDKSPQSGSRRRSGLIELCMKLIDTNFARQFLDNGMVHRLNLSIKGQIDTITTFLLASAISLLLCSGSMIITDVRGCCQILLKTSPSMLGEVRDVGAVARERIFNMSKASRASLVDLQRILTGSRIWSSERPLILTPQVVALRSIDLGVRKLRETGDFKETISNSTIKQLVSILMSKMPLLTTRLSEDNFIIIQLTISILESYSISIGSITEEELDVVEELPGLGPLLSVAIDEDGKYSQVQILALRLILNVTNNNPLLCERFASRELISAIFGIVSTKFSTVSEELLDGKESSVLDPVLLALGSLINFTEWSSAARNLMSKLQRGSATFVEELLRLFLGQVDEITKVFLLPTHDCPS